MSAISLEDRFWQLPLSYVGTNKRHWMENAFLFYSTLVPSYLDPYLCYGNSLSAPLSISTQRVSCRSIWHYSILRITYSQYDCKFMLITLLLRRKYHVQCQHDLEEIIILAYTPCKNLIIYEECVNEPYTQIGLRFHVN